MYIPPVHDLFWLFLLCTFIIICQSSTPPTNPNCAARLAGFEKLVILTKKTMSKNEQECGTGGGVRASRTFTPVASQSTFYGLIKNGRMIVDKTLLIKDFIESSKEILLFTAPHRWGKSLNLDMVECFFRYQVDKHGNEVAKEETEAYKVFKLGEGLEEPLSISSYSTMVDEHLGQYITISVSLVDVFGTTCASVLKALRIAISDAFLQHEHMLEVYQKYLKDNSKHATEQRVAQKHFDTFMAFLYPDEPMDEITVINGLFRLSHMLNKHYEKEVYIFIDDYDKLLLYINQHGNQVEIQKTVELYRKFMSYTFKRNRVMKRGYLTGVNEVAKYATLESTNFVVEAFLHSKLSVRFGFFQEEIEALYLKIPTSEEDKEEMRKWYGGYSLFSQAGDKKEVYDPYAIVTVLESQKFINQRNPSEATALIKPLFRLDKFRTLVEDLLQDQDIVVNFSKLQMDNDDMNGLKRLGTLASPDHIPAEETVKSFLKYLYWAGFLSPSNPQLDKVRLPNKQIGEILQRNLIVFYEQEVQIPWKLVDAVTEALLDLLRNLDKEDPKDLETAVKNMIEPLELEDFSSAAGGVHSNEYIYQSLVVMAAIQCRQYKTGMEVSFPTMAKDRPGVAINKLQKPNRIVHPRADLVMMNKEHGLGFIIEFKHNDDVSKGLVQSEEYKKIFKTITEVQNIKRVCINVNSKDKSVNVLCKVSSKF